MATQTTRVRNVGVDIVGLRPFVKALRQLDDPDRFIDRLKDVNVEAAQAVVREAKSNAATRLEVSASQRLQVSRAAKGASVALTADRATPFAFGAEFGAFRDQRRDTKRGAVLGWNQFRPWRGNGPDAGYFLWPAIRSTRDEVIDLYEQAVGRIVAEAFPD